MAIQLSVEARNARLDAIETTLGTSPLLRFYTGSMPANTAAAATGTLVAEATLPSDFMANAASGSKSLSGTWQDTAANNAGTIGYYRIYNSAGTRCDIQGTVTNSGGGGDMEVQNTSVNAGQQITITAYTLTDANA